MAQLLGNFADRPAELFEDLKRIKPVHGRCNCGRCVPIHDNNLIPASTTKTAKTNMMRQLMMLATNGLKWKAADILSVFDVMAQAILNGDRPIVPTGDVNAKCIQDYISSLRQLRIRF